MADLSSRFLNPFGQHKYLVLSPTVWLWFSFGFPSVWAFFFAGGICRLIGSSTACIVALNSSTGQMEIANLGDSGALVVQPDGTVILETKDFAAQRLSVLSFCSFCRRHPH